VVDDVAGAIDLLTLRVSNFLTLRVSNCALITDGDASVAVVVPAAC
jgi:hypothetical protein